MAITYGNTDIPSARVTVRSGGTIAISAAFSNTAGLVGVMDTDNGEATTGETISINSSSDAETQFGETSELTEQVKLAFGNDTSTVYACPVSETEETETFDTVSSGTFSNVPALDPTVQPNHEITAQDTTEGASVTVNIVREEGEDIASPTDANTINLNPNTGEWEADESSTYEITYTHGSYNEAIRGVVSKVPRQVGVCTENNQIVGELGTQLSDYANDFGFMHGAFGLNPEVDSATYTNSYDDRRLIAIAPSRAYLDAANENMVRTVGAVVGKQASKDLGDSTTYETVAGFADLHTKYTNSELGTLIDEQVLTLRQGGGIKIVKDMTTSTDPRFERIFASEITDEATEISHQISQGYVGEANTLTNQKSLGESHDSSYSEMEDDALLDNFDVGVSEGGDNQVDLDIALDIVDVIDTVDVTITVGDVIRNGGAS
ncbi:DUF2586 family protein [Natrinema sp. DC36]|uniref:DUF2586 family protein n=1 Tax=Natrinema sp. DC36 TaxID=2878680 RepID=UPI001CF075F2|nr:DUF2586 family protein [Natrinema sp. DC36]